MKQMVKDLNQMLSDRLAGDEPDFDGFMEKYGDLFGDNPPQSLTNSWSTDRWHRRHAEPSRKPPRKPAASSMTAMDKIDDPDLQRRSPNSRSTSRYPQPDTPASTLPGDWNMTLCRR
jgi:hypothetical protein